LLIGVLLPGDSLLFTAGLLASSSSPVHLPVVWVLAASVGGALLGAQTGFLLGRRAASALHRPSRGPRVRAGVAYATALLGRYGHARAVMVSRFVPFVRTVLSPTAGALGVAPRTFLLWQAVSGALWAVGFVLGGYLLGNEIPNVDHYLPIVITAIVGVSMIPVAIEMRRARRT
jgi:membrane-associated protein